MVREAIFDDAEPFLDSLRPTSPKELIYRGQANADWQLTPSAFRPGTQFSTEFGMEPVEKVIARYKTWAEAERVPEMPPTFDYRLRLEVDTLIRFFRAADGAGLPLPEDSQVIRWHLENYLESDWPRREIRSILALAQHHGLPTRLLDWTWDWRIAAFLAARDVFDQPASPARLAVWLLDAAWLKLRELSFPPPPGEMKPAERPYRLEIVTAPSATNTNLRAQNGLFTLLVPRQDSGVRADSPIDELVGEEGTLLSKHTLRAEEASQLLKILACEGVTSASVFPDFGGVVRSLKDVGLWHPSPP